MPQLQTLISWPTPSAVPVPGKIRALRRAPATSRLIQPTRPLTENLAAWPHHWSWNLRQIDAPAAWAITRGDPRVVIAVVDTGIDPHHPDLRGKVLSGLDVVACASDSVDDLGHGTNVAGVAASRGWRRPGLSGVAPACRVMPIKCNIHGTGHVRAEHIAAGIRAAVAAGAQVVNLSVGVVEGEEFLTPDSLGDLSDAIREALAVGTVVVCAAGPGSTVTSWPGAWSQDPRFQGLISVGAADRRGRMAPCTPRNDYITVLAPTDVLATKKGGGYSLFGGTSAAAPHVAGIAALLLSIRPEASPVQIRDWIVRGAMSRIVRAGGALGLAMSEA